MSYDKVATPLRLLMGMSSFIATINPTPFGFFDSEVSFQSDADRMIHFVKQKLGDAPLQVELTSKQIWACFEEATCEYSNQIAKVKIQSELLNLMGMQTGSVDLINKYPRQSLDYLMRMAEPYASYAGVGGSYDQLIGYFNLVDGQQDYNFYTDLRSYPSGSILFQDTNIMPTKGKLRIMDVFHTNPIAAQQYLLNAANVTNFMAQNFNYESYVNSTIFYVLPVFEDVLRRSMLDMAYRVRRSNYSYDIYGSNLRIYPVPNMQPYMIGKLFIRLATDQNPYDPSYQDDSINGVSGPNNVPFGNLMYGTINQPGRQWIREYTFALCREVLGQIRSKYKSIPIPNAELVLNGEDLISQGREDKTNLLTEIKEWLQNMTYDKLLEQSALRSENIMKQLKAVPMPHPIIVG